MDRNQLDQLLAYWAGSKADERLQYHSYPGCTAFLNTGGATVPGSRPLIRGHLVGDWRRIDQALRAGLSAFGYKVAYIAYVPTKAKDVSRAAAVPCSISAIRNTRCEARKVIRGAIDDIYPSRKQVAI